MISGVAAIGEPPNHHNFAETKIRGGLLGPRTKILTFFRAVDTMQTHGFSATVLQNTDGFRIANTRDSTLNFRRKRNLR